MFVLVYFRWNTCISCTRGNSILFIFSCNIQDLALTLTFNMEICANTKRVILSNKFLIYMFLYFRTFKIQSPSFLVIHFCVGLDLLHGFVTTWRTRDYNSSRPYPSTYLAWVALTGAHAPASIVLLVTGPHKTPSHDWAAVFAEALLINILVYATERVSPQTAILVYVCGFIFPWDLSRLCCKYPLYAGDRYMSIHIRKSILL